MIVIEDDFYPNPDEVRKNALDMFLYPGQKGHKNMFAGQRTLGSFSTQNRLYCKNRMEQLINRKIVQFPSSNSNAAFTLGKEFNSQGLKYDNWVHMDKGNHEKKRSKELQSQMFAAVCYLSPNAPRGHGTALFRSNKNNSNWVTPEYTYNKTVGFRGEWQYREKEEWELHTYVDNLYNRIVVYPATYWHAPYNAGFGHDKETGRLIQIFFFYAEKSGVEKGYEQC